MGSHKRKSDHSERHNTDKHRKVPRVDVSALVVPASQVNLVEAEGKSCTHEVAWPPGAADSCSSLPPARKAGLPARSYEFALDPFQQTACNCLEAGKLSEGCPSSVWLLLLAEPRSCLIRLWGQSLCCAFHRVLALHYGMAELGPSTSGLADLRLSAQTISRL